MHGHLPPRYEHFAARWETDFWELAEPGLKPGARVLDVGSGRRPALPLHQRPDGITYVGLDLSPRELEAAPPGSYDAVVVSDVCTRVPELEGRFDLIVTWQVLEHVDSLERALANLRLYLTQGGHAVALFSGRYSAFGTANLLLPRRLGARLVARIMKRDPQTVFPAYYDRCHRTGLEHLLESWSQVRVISAWNGATYFNFFRPLQACYVFYEEWTAVAGRDNLATHYYLQLRK